MWLTDDHLPHAKSGVCKVSNVKYDINSTALLLVDPYNDFLSEGGKIWPAIKEIATEVDLLNNLRVITAAIRDADIPVFYVPHRRWQPGDYENWDHPNPTHHEPMSHGNRAPSRNVRSTRYKYSLINRPQ